MSDYYKTSSTSTGKKRGPKPKRLVVDASAKVETSEAPTYNLIYEDVRRVAHAIIVGLAKEMGRSDYSKIATALGNIARSVASCHKAEADVANNSKWAERLNKLSDKEVVELLQNPEAAKKVFN